MIPRWFVALLLTAGITVGSLAVFGLICAIMELVR